MFKYSMTCQWCKKTYQSSDPYGVHGVCPHNKIELTEYEIEAIQSNSYAWAVEEFGISRNRVGRIKEQDPNYKLKVQKWYTLTKDDKKRIMRMLYTGIAKKYGVSERTARKWKTKIRTGQ